ncbi:MAG: hypothetical protein E7665_00385 [Ruminococcaceae bacterium]|nr:hypothetical protein [Oscillospiraceae bacterium]
MTRAIINIWLKLTDISSTALGEKIDDILFAIIGIVLFIFLFSRFFSYLEKPSRLSFYQEIENVKRKYGSEICCSNCIWLVANECTTTKHNGIEIDDPDHKYCAYFRSR